MSVDLTPDPKLSPEIEKCLAHAEQSAFLLDFDGTMVYLAEHPDHVSVPKSLIKNLQIISLNPHLSFAIVTGRALQSLDEQLDGMTTIALGSHGAEWRSSPGSEALIIADPMPMQLRRALRIVASLYACIFEDKIYTVSMHLPLNDMDRNLGLEISAALGAQADQFVVRKVGRTYEVLQKNINKGFGIRHLMQQPVFAGKPPVYIGDDVGIDLSLKAVDDLGGKQFFVSNQPIKDQLITHEHMGVDAVNCIVQRLADYIPDKK